MGPLKRNWIETMHKKVAFNEMKDGTERKLSEVRPI